MEKHTIRREFLKLKNKGLSYKQCQNELENRFEIKKSLRTLKRWTKRFIEDDEWNLRDTPQIPSKLPIKFSEKEKKVIERIRRNFGYGPKKTRIQAQNEGIDMSVSIPS